MRTLVLQMRRTDTDSLGIGFTVSRKVGNAVVRNRVRRRLRHALRRARRSLFRRGHDYVLIGRRGALSEPFGRIVADLEAAVARAHGRAATARTDRPDG